MADPFFIATPCRNAARWIGRCIAGVRRQTARGWEMVVLDDASDDDTARAAIEAARGDPRIRIVERAERRYALRNIVEAIDRSSPHNSIVVVLDGDDWLSDPDALAAVAREYESDPALEALWTRHVHDDGSRAPLCRPIPDGVSPLDCDWRSSHLKTFRKRLVWGVDRRIWLDDRGDWRKSAYDVALYLPLLCLARKSRFLDRVCYVYNRSAGRDHTHAQQAADARAIWERVRESEARRKPRNVLFFVNGVKGGDRRFAWKPGTARPPVGALTLMARLRARGHSVTLCDRYLNPDWWPTPRTMDRADVIGVYASTPNAADARRILERARRESKARLLAGGPHASIRPDELLDRADAVCRGEADDAILDLVEGDAVGLVAAGRKRDLDAVPFPAYDYLARRKLAYCATWPFDDTTPAWVLNSSRGCPHACAFCEVRAVMGRQWYGQSPERMVNDAAELMRVAGAKGVYFREDNFGRSRDRVLGFCAEMKRRGLRVPWACEMRADRGADEEVMGAMAGAGCKGVYVGFESGSERMLERFRKGVTVQESLATGENARRFGIAVAASLVVGHPSETDYDRAATDALIQEVRPCVVWRNRYREPVTAGGNGR